MKKITKTYYVCEICNEEYEQGNDGKSAALKCEALPCEAPKAKAGDTIKFTSNFGQGLKEYKGKISSVNCIRDCNKHIVLYRIDVFGRFNTALCGDDFEVLKDE